MPEPPGPRRVPLKEWLPISWPLGYNGTEMIMADPEKILNEVIILATIVGRLGQVEEVARYLTFPTSDEASFFTGSTPVANGGRYMS